MNETRTWTCLDCGNVWTDGPHVCEICGADFAMETLAFEVPVGNMPRLKELLQMNKSRQHARESYGKWLMKNIDDLKGADVRLTFEPMEPHVGWCVRNPEELPKYQGEWVAINAELGVFAHSKDLSDIEAEVLARGLVGQHFVHFVEEKEAS